MKRCFKLWMIFSVVLLVPILCQSFDRWPDTGQIRSDADAFRGDFDSTLNTHSYVKLDANGNDLARDAESWTMVRDKVTGLIWEVKTNDCSIHDRNHTYAWNNTTKFIAAVNGETFGGFSDWRLPSMKELSTLVKSEKLNPAIDTGFFPHTVSSYYWSSTTHANFTGISWYVNFGYGNVNYKYRSSSYYVRAVRGGQ